MGGVRLLRNALIRALVVVLVVVLVRGLATAFSLDDVAGTLLRIGLPLFLGLALHRKFGPRRDTRSDRALYPALYGWLLGILIDWLWVGASAAFGNLFTEGIRLPLGFVLAYPVLWVLDLVWRPSERAGKGDPMLR